tara:strand:- start:3070 stop:6408 length:3339 start_codon:yes stop_codon:yes gene_type:complete
MTGIDGSKKVFPFTFPYQNISDIKIELVRTPHSDNTAGGVTKTVLDSTKFTLAPDAVTVTLSEFYPTSTFQENTGAPKAATSGANGYVVTGKVYRDTDSSKLGATFYPGSAIRSTDLNDNFTQNLYVTQEAEESVIESKSESANAVAAAEAFVAKNIGTDEAPNWVTRGNAGTDSTGAADPKTGVGKALYDADQAWQNATKQAGVTPPGGANAAITIAEATNDTVELYVADSNGLRGGGTNATTDPQGVLYAVTTADAALQTDGSNKMSGDIIFEPSAYLFETTLTPSNQNLASNLTIELPQLSGVLVGTSDPQGKILADNINNDAITTPAIADAAITNPLYADHSIDSDKLTEATVVTSTEHATATANDTSFYTTAASDARYFNIDSGEEIRAGETWTGDDATIATTAAIDDRIRDLVDDVGGFVPLASEADFPAANPDVNDPPGGGTIVSIGVLGASYTPTAGTCTIPDATLTNITGSDVTITDCGTTVLSAGYGCLVETTSTLHEYKFHRLTPKATEVTTVAGQSAQIALLGTADAIADMNTLAVADVIADMNTLGTADIVADMNLLATTGTVADMATIASTAGLIAEIGTVAGIHANVTSVANNEANVTAVATNETNINAVENNEANINLVAAIDGDVTTVAAVDGNVTTVADSINSVNHYADTYQVAASAPAARPDTTTLQEGDLWFDTANDLLKVYTGTAWNTCTANATTLVERAEYTTKGDILLGTGVGTLTAVGISGSDGKFLKADSGTTSGVTWSTVAQTDTTYSISCVDGDNTDEEKIRLTTGGSGSGTDDIVLKAGTGLTISRTNDVITFTGQNTYTHPNHGVSGGGDATSSADGDITIRNDAITTAKIIDDAVTTAKIDDGAVTVTKLADADLQNLAGCQAGASAALALLTQAEVETLDDLTASTAELNLLDGVTSSTAELNKLDGFTGQASDLNYCDVVTAGTVQLLKAAVVDASKNISGFNDITMVGDLVSSTGDITATAGRVTDEVGDVRKAGQRGVGAGLATTLTIADRGHIIYMEGGQCTIPANVFDYGDIVTIYNNGTTTTNLLINQGTSLTMKFPQGGTTGGRILAGQANTGNICTVVFLGPTVCVISGEGLS